MLCFCLYTLLKTYSDKTQRKANWLPLAVLQKREFQPVLISDNSPLQAQLPRISSSTQQSNWPRLSSPLLLAILVHPKEINWLHRMSPHLFFGGQNKKNQNTQPLLFQHTLLICVTFSLDADVWSALYHPIFCRAARSPPGHQQGMRG